MLVKMPGREVIRAMWRAHKARLITCDGRQPTAEQLHAAWEAHKAESGEAR